MNVGEARVLSAWLIAKNDLNKQKITEFLPKVSVTFETFEDAILVEGNREFEEEGRKYEPPSNLLDLPEHLIN